MCYRTPAEIMALAGRLLASIDPALPAPRAVRAGGAPPWREQVPPGPLPVELDTTPVDHERLRP